MIIGREYLGGAGNANCAEQEIEADQGGDELPLNSGVRWINPKQSVAVNLKADSEQHQEFSYKVVVSK